MSIVSIIGRPNVGKSTLFNRLIGKRDAVVHKTPNLTRDRHYGEFEWRDQLFTLIDTGGIGQSQEADFMKLVEEQADIAINESHLILFIIDNREPLTPDDYYIAGKLRPFKERVMLIVNKWDSEANMINDDVYKLGFDDVFPVSAEHQINTDALKENIYKELPKRKSSRIEGLKLAVVGKPNVGKSSFVNAVMRDNRMIVSEIAGTTRDSVDTHFNYKKRHMIMVDTAGIRRASRITEPTEYYTVLRSKLAMRDADIVIMIIDASSSISRQDKRILEDALNALKPVIICFNKTDIIEADNRNEYYKSMKEDIQYADYLPIINTSFKNSKNVFKVIDKSLELYDRFPISFKSADLNTLLFDIIAKKKHPIKRGKRIRFFRLYQLSGNPVKFVVESSAGSNIDKSYKNYIINAIRRELQIREIVFKVYFRSKQS